MASAEEMEQRLGDEPIGVPGAWIEQPFSIVCLSSQPWDTALRTNRQQVMLRAARRGHRVLFVETGHFLGKHLWSLLRRGGRRSLSRRLFATEVVAPGVLVRKALNILIWGSKYGIPKAINSAVTARTLRRIVATMPKPVVLWIYDPGAVRITESLGEEFAVYDCVDDYTEQVASPRKRAMVAACDRVAAARSRLVFTTSTTMYERQARLNPTTHLVPNAGDYKHFFPLKLYEYFAAGKPVVASGVPELGGMEPDVVLAVGPRAFVEAVRDAVDHDGEEDRLRRRQLAARNTWETKTERLLGLVRRELEAGGATG